MYNETLQKAAFNAVAKNKMIRNNPLRAFVYSMIAGFFLGITMYFIHAVTAPFLEVGSPAVKLIMGLGFPIALLLVLFAGCDLYTGDTMYCTTGLLRKEISWADAARVLIMAFMGNWAGGLLFTAIIYGAGFLDENSAAFINILTSASGKMSPTSTELFFRGFLGNVMVCLAIWMAMKTEGNSAKILLIFYTIFAFVSSSYEHSIANMAFLSMGLTAKAQIGPENLLLSTLLDPINFNNYFRNILVTGLGNLCGGATVGLTYYFVSQTK